MNLRAYALITGFVALPMITATCFYPINAQAQDSRVSEERIAEGDWGGPVGDGHITFRFSYENGLWLGYFVSERNGELYPVERLQVSGRSVSFIHKSKPELVFDLSVEENDRILSGTATRPNGMATLYSLTRKPS